MSGHESIDEVHSFGGHFFVQDSSGKAFTGSACAARQQLFSSNTHLTKVPDFNNCIALWRLGARAPGEKYRSPGWQSPQPSHEPPHTAPTPVTLNKSVEIRRGGHTE